MKLKFLIGGALILAAAVYLIVSSMGQGSQYYLTVEELVERKAEMTGKPARVSGVVLGDSIQYDDENLVLQFDVAHIPGDMDEIEAAGGIAMVLHNASLDTSLAKVTVVYEGVRPDLLKNEAQAIMTGRLDEQGVFHADELLLKCPTKYEEAVPEQAVQAEP